MLTDHQMNFAEETVEAKTNKTCEFGAKLNTYKQSKELNFSDIS